MTRTEAAELLGVLTAAYPHFKMTEPTARLYLDALERHDPRDGIEAVRHLIMEETFFPTIATTLRYVAGMRRRRVDGQPVLRGLLPPRANKEEALQKVEEMRRLLRPEQEGET